MKNKICNLKTDEEYLTVASLYITLGKRSLRKGDDLRASKCFDIASHILDTLSIRADTRYFSKSDDASKKE